MTRRQNEGAETLWRKSFALPPYSDHTIEKRQTGNEESINKKMVND
jgi:hypothetical protein